MDNKNYSYHLFYPKISLDENNIEYISVPSNNYFLFRFSVGERTVNGETFSLYSPSFFSLKQVEDRIDDEGVCVEYGFKIIQFKHNTWGDWKIFKVIMGKDNE